MIYCVVRYNFMFQSLPTPQRQCVPSRDSESTSLRSAILVRSWTKNSLITWGLGFVAGNVKVTTTVKVKQSLMAKRNGRKGLGSNHYSGY